jgi:hypothetical protein
MPSYVESGHGFGEAICKGRGFVRWGNEADCDSVVCIMMLSLPFAPRKAIHTYNWNGNSCESIPIRWSVTLVLSAMLRHWLYALLIVGALLLILVGMSFFDRGEGIERMRVVLSLASLPFLGVGGLGLWLLSYVDRRSRNIRWVLGPHERGSSDPVTWTGELQKSMPSSRDMFGTDTYSEAAYTMLTAGEYSRAMWAARLTAALDNPDKGEELTDTILQDEKVRAAIEQVRKNPQSWPEVMKPAGSSTA